MRGKRFAGIGRQDPGSRPAGRRFPAASLHHGWGHRTGGWLLASAALLSAVVLTAGVTRAPARSVAASPSAAPGSDLLPPPAPATRRPTYILFQNGTSTVERQFLLSLRQDGPARDRDDVRVVLLNSLDGPIAKRFRIRETPTMVAVEPGGREITRRVGPQAITTALAARHSDRPATHASTPAPATCRVWRGPRLRWIEEADPRARRVYRRFAGGRWGVPDIFKAMSLRPDLMEKTLELSESGHFADGYLDRQTKERIATLVSALNGSHYCTGSHGGGLQTMGVTGTEIAALARGDLEAAALSPRDRALFEFIRRLTLKPEAVTDQDVAKLRARGWRDEQIFEAAFDASLFAFFNRVANTYGLDYPPDGWKPSPQQLRAALPPAK